MNEKGYKEFEKENKSFINFSMSSVPKDTYLEFIEIAKGFGDNYASTLKHLLEFYKTFFVVLETQTKVLLYFNDMKDNKVDDNTNTINKRLKTLGEKNE